jgi:hypothetical protein
MKSCQPWCCSIAHGTRGYCTKRCRDKAERDGTIEDRPNKVLFVDGVRVPDWAPFYDDGDL